MTYNIRVRLNWCYCVESSAHKLNYTISEHLHRLLIPLDLTTRTLTLEVSLLSNRLHVAISIIVRDALAECWELIIKSIFVESLGSISPRKYQMLVNTLWILRRLQQGNGIRCFLQVCLSFNKQWTDFTGVVFTRNHIQQTVTPVEIGQQNRNSLRSRQRIWSSDMTFKLTNALNWPC